MTDYNQVRLEQGGQVVAYFAPTATVDFAHANDVLSAPRPGANRSAIARDRVLYANEIQLNSKFLDSAELPADQVTALQAIFGAGPVTAEQQLLRLLHYAQEVGGSMNFYHRDRNYTASNDAGVNILNAVFPQVVIKQVKETWSAGRTIVDVVVVLTVGIPRPS